jgi:ferredoxin-NADP reductase
MNVRAGKTSPEISLKASARQAASSERYRLSIKREAHGVAGAYIDEKLQVGDILDVSAARGGFTLRAGEAPVVLLSAGIGATPVLAMLHALAAEGSLVAPWSPQRP